MIGWHRAEGFKSKKEKSFQILRILFKIYLHKPEEELLNLCINERLKILMQHTRIYLLNCGLNLT